jgi:peroxiredoxin family protein/rhodanese-related sulfurtransferase/TusA-related sulfurtransferase
VNIAGYTAADIVQDFCSVFHWHDVASLDLNNGLLIDVRTPMEFSVGSIDKAVNIPVDELRQRLTELPKDKTIYVFCQVGLRGYIACRILMQHGFISVKNLSGGYKTYQLSIQEQSNEDIYEYDKIMKDDDMKPVLCGDPHPCANKVDVEVDASGLQCPGPIMKLFTAVKAMNYGETIRIRATDPAFEEDIRAWCSKTGNPLVSLSGTAGELNAVIRKERVQESFAPINRGNNDKTMVIFSNDLDRTIASFIIANGAAAMGRKVTMFFTFWGLNILRKSERVKVKKDVIATMFGFMMPRGSKKLTLSKMNMGGIGGLLIRYLMKKKNITSLEELIEQARNNGVVFVACMMSMDIMGIKKEELIDGVIPGGVASFLGAAEDSNMSLFI